jgi:hypothetical protein
VAGDLHWQVGVTLGIGGLIGSTLGAHLMNRLQGNTLGLIFGVILLITGLRMALAGDPGVGGTELPALLRILIGVVVGIVAGLASGLAGVGGGVVMVPAMVFLLGLDQHTSRHPLHCGRRYPDQRPQPSRGLANDVHPRSGRGRDSSPRYARRSVHSGRDADPGVRWAGGRDGGADDL